MDIDRHGITEILLKVALNGLKIKDYPIWNFVTVKLRVFTYILLANNLDCL
jgi:hypothetical protein